jgi:hypothetical protein
MQPIILIIFQLEIQQKYMIDSIPRKFNKNIYEHSFFFCCFVLKFNYRVWSLLVFSSYLDYFVR